mmetsp:Transcript_97404/g.231755  ORF Transcript_97404/g.231755 Transcript_97404/m.231755 type:complete len:761 (+) Transcript_97404:54-2336(+)
MRALAALVSLAWPLGAVPALDATANSTKYTVLEMYAAAKSGDDVSSPGNVDLFDAAGLAKYLVTEVVVETGKAAERPTRDKGIDTIVKYRIRVRNNMSSSDVNVQAEFSKYVPFENGALVTPADAEMFARSGDLVGVQSYHPPHGDVRYPLQRTFYWFSLNGPCPNQPDGQKSSNCTTYQPGLVPKKKSQVVAGGLCKRFFTKNIPDGTPGCSYYIEKVETAKLDSVVGITDQDCGGRKCADWGDFRSHCSNATLSFTYSGVKYCKEYDFPDCISSCQDACKPQNEVGIPFWTGRCDPARNEERAAMIEKAFGGSQTDSYYTTNPRCDQYGPMCNKPVPDAGVAYCHRDASGVCDACYVPGTTHPASPRPPSQVACRYDLFLNKKLPQYKDFLPKCASSCSGACSLSSESAACCVYIGKCKRTWQQEDWGSCDADCGNGTRYRKVSCPFEDIFGPCDESTRPANSTDCRGDTCPWSKDHFGNWSECDNGCGNGTANQSLICQCPDDCPLGDKECEKSPKPPQPSRPCFPQGKAQGFCSECPAEGGDCTKCAKGFDLQDTSCRRSKRVALATYQVEAPGLSLKSEWLASAFVPAFKDALLGATNVSVDVLNLTDSPVVASLLAARALRALADNSSVYVAVAAEGEDDEDLAQLKTKMANNLDQMAKSLPQALAQHGCTPDHSCQLGTVGVSLLREEQMCPEGQAWNGNSCGMPGPGPKPPGSGFPTWAIGVIVVLILLLVAAVVAWTCGTCKRNQDPRLLA